MVDRLGSRITASKNPTTASTPTSTTPPPRSHIAHVAAVACEVRWNRWVLAQAATTAKTIAKTPTMKRRLVKMFPKPSMFQRSSLLKMRSY